MKFIAPLTGLILVLPAVLAAPPSDSDGDAGDSSTGGKYRETAHMTWRGEVVEGLEQFTKEAHSYAQGVADQSLNNVTAMRHNYTFAYATRIAHLNKQYNWVVLDNTIEPIFDCPEIVHGLRNPDHDLIGGFDTYAFVLGTVYNPGNGTNYEWAYGGYVTKEVGNTITFGLPWEKPE